jgi:hypothetical protein
MSTITDTRRAILDAAARRPDGLAAPSAHLPPAQRVQKQVQVGADPDQPAERTRRQPWLRFSVPNARSTSPRIGATSGTAGGARSPAAVGPNIHPGWCRADHQRSRPSVRIDP